MACSSCGKRKAAAEALSQVKKAWTVTLADGTVATVTSDAEHERLERRAKERAAAKGYTVK